MRTASPTTPSAPIRTAFRKALTPVAGLRATGLRATGLRATGLLATTGLLASVVALAPAASATAAPAGSSQLSAGAYACAATPEIVRTTISPKTVVLGVSDFRGILLTTKIRRNGCSVSKVEMGLFGPNFIGTYELEKVGTTKGVTTYDKGLRITPGSIGNSEAGTWSSYVTAYGTRPAEAAGPTFRLLRRATLTTDATPEPIASGDTLTVNGRLARANWETLSYKGYVGRTVTLQFRKAGSTSYKKIGTATTTTGGNVRAAVTVTGDGCYRFVFKGSSTTAGATSKADCVNVR